MDQIERFEKVLNLVEKVRSLDLLTAQIVKQINQQQIELYKEVTTECFTEKDAVSEKKTEKKEKGKEKMDGKISIENLAEYLKKAATDMKNIKENPPEAPIPPETSTTPQENQLDAQLNKLRKMSVIVSEHLRIQADMHKYAAQAIAETHKLSFELYKDIENVLNTSK